jgi:hypothetical protein
MTAEALSTRLVARNIRFDCQTARRLGVEQGAALRSRGSSARALPVEEYRSQRSVTENTWSRKDPLYYVKGGDKIEVLGDLSAVGFTVFGEKFCKAVVGNVNGSQ